MNTGDAVDAFDAGTGCRGSQECPSDHPLHVVSGACLGCGSANAQACGQRAPHTPCAEATEPA